MHEKKQEVKQGDENSRLFREAFFGGSKKNQVVPVKRRKPFRVSILLIPFLWLIFVSVSAYAVFISPYNRVSNVSVEGSEKMGNERLMRLISDMISGDYMGFIPKNNFFLMTEGSVRDHLLKEFPILSDVEVRKTYPNHLNIRVSERDRILLWCVSGSCWLVDDSGSARDAAAANREENSRFVIRVEEDNGSEFSDGSSVIDVEIRDRILSLDRGIRGQSGIDVESVIRTPSRVSGEFRFKTGSGWEILVSTKIHPEKTVKALSLILEKEIGSDRIEKLRYIDLRTENRAYFAFKQEESSAGEEKKE